MQTRIIFAMDWRQWLFALSLWFGITACQTGALVTSDLDEDKVAAAAKGCKPVRDVREFIDIHVSAEGSGRQCLIQDLTQRNIYALDNGQNVGKPRFNTGIIGFYKANGIVLDLQNHLVSGKPFYNIVGVRAHASNQDLFVCHGRIETPGLLSIGMYLGDIQVGLGDNYTRPDGYDPFPEDNTPVFPNASWPSEVGQSKYIRRTRYRSTKFAAENLAIVSGGRGIVMVGADNEVRNNVIEVDGQTAIYLYGPRPVIEGNTFIVHLDRRDESTLPAIVKLRDADGAIIRNNRFLVRGGLLTGLMPGKSAAAINLLTSKDVLIEGNLIDGAKQLVRQDDESSSIERGNALK